MPSTYDYPPADPEVAAIVGQLSASLEDLPAVLEQFEESLKQGATLGELRGITREEFDSLYRIACNLCNSGEFKHALPIALQLMLHDPRDSRYAFQAGSCLQRLAEYNYAAILFARALDLKQDDAAAAYRLGECLLAINHPFEAKAMFDMAIENARGKFHCRELQDMAEAKLSSLNH